MPHFARMADYEADQCEQGDHVWVDQYGNSHEECLCCDDSRCLHAKGTADRCNAAMTEHGHAGFCLEHENECLMENIQYYAEQMGKEETVEARRATYAVMIQAAAEVCLGIGTVAEIELRNRRG